MDAEQKQAVQQPETGEPIEKTVNVDIFNKYRGAFLREKLRELNVKDHEMDAALNFINERVDENDSNLDDVIDELKVRMRLEQRRQYVDPSPMNPAAWKPKPSIDRRDTGKQIFERLRKLQKI
ncbi:hypothetical protein [Ureibacillus terrenus]|uniref:hypothetical protein n=1 Tax=Ureibacillus terrenus TaxID=118246 RepID=UPI002E1DBEDB|nr:hypothetical protein [Ureibacillus terrenus]